MQDSLLFTNKDAAANTEEEEEQEQVQSEDEGIEIETNFFKNKIKILIVDDQTFNIMGLNKLLSIY